MTRRQTTSGLSQLLLVAGVLCLAVSPAAGGTIKVNTADDSNNTSDGKCSLREAMQAAFQGSPNECSGATAAPNTITFDGNYTITLTDRLPDVANKLTIDGSGKTIVISGGNKQRIFKLPHSASDLALSNLALKDGDDAAGGAVLVQHGKLSMTNVTVTGCDVTSNGGAIQSNGDVYLTNVNFFENTAKGDGGAIQMGSATILIVNNATFTSNTAGKRGGAIHLSNVDSTTESPRPVELTGCIFTLNKAEGEGAEQGGGAIWAKGDDDPEDVFLITGAQFLLNSAPKGGGGAILLAFGSRLAYADPLFPSAGGIYGSNFFANSAGGTGNDGMGGAIFSRGKLTVVASSFVDNASTASGGGAIGHNTGSPGSLTVANVTFSGNTADTNGGAIANLHASGSLTVLSSTFSENEATTGSGGALFNNGSISVVNSVIADSLAGTNCGGKPVTDSGNNLQHPDADCGASIPVDDPLLEGLSVNPGPNLLVLTMAAKQCSPVLGAGKAAACSAGPVAGLDARLIPRPLGNPVCDIGAFESENLAPVFGLDVTPDAGLSFGFVQTGTASGLKTATLSNSSCQPLAGLEVSIGGPFVRNGGTCGATLAGQSSCTVLLQFVPVTKGPETGTLEISAAGGLSDSIPLSGTGAAPAALELTPGAGLSFGTVPTNGTAGPQAATLTNTGQITASGILVSVSGDFAHNGGSCGTTLAPGASCTLLIQFAPQSATAHHGALSVTAAGSLADSIPLSGNGIAPPPFLDVAPDAGLNFLPTQPGQSRTIHATVQNKSAISMNNLTPSFSGSPDFSVGRSLLSKRCPPAPFTVGAGDFCYLPIRFHSSTVGAKSGTLTVSDGTTNVDAIPLSGICHVEGYDLTPDAGLAFGNVVQGTTSVPLIAAVTNTGATGITGLTISIAGGSGTFAIAPGGSCPADSFTLGPANSCTVYVTFTPATASAFNASLRSSDGVSLLDAIPLTGSGFVQDPGLDLTPDTGLDFALVKTLSASDPLTATVTNTGNGSVTGLSIAAGGNFTIVGGNCGSSLAPGASCLVQVAAMPDSDGPNPGTLTATADGGPSDTIGLVATGFTPSSGLNLTPDAGLDFGFVESGSTASAKSATLTNTGSSDVTGIAFNAGGDFTVGTTTCAALLEAGASCTVQVGFAPSGDGLQGSSLMASADGGLIDVVPLTGQGYTPGLAAGFGSAPLPPGPIQFGTTAINTTTGAELTISETGNADLVVSNPVLSGAHASNFILAGVAFPLLIPDGGASRKLGLTCQPSAAGLRSATLTLSTNDPQQPGVSFDLRCTGFNPSTAPSFGATPAAPGPITFGQAPVGTLATARLTFEAAGGSALTISSPVFGGAHPGDFTVPAGTFPLTIAAGRASRDVTLTCSPTVASVRSATLGLTTNDPSQPEVTFKLRCTGLEPLNVGLGQDWMLGLVVALLAMMGIRRHKRRRMLPARSRSGRG
jgi:CSLREA domain-containing protein